MQMEEEKEKIYSWRNAVLEVDTTSLSGWLVVVLLLNHFFLICCVRNIIACLNYYFLKKGQKLWTESSPVSPELNMHSWDS